MKSVIQVLSKIIMIAGVLFSSQYAGAQATRTWVSGLGDDAAACSRSSPCKTFVGAYNKTAAGGEITCMDPGGFGTITISKSITITGAGTLGSVLSAGTVGITIAAAATDVVNIRNLDINGAGSGTQGINITSPSIVNIENVVIDNITGSGIKANLSADGAKISVKNTSITAKPGSTASGIDISSSAGNVALTADNITVTGFLNGVSLSTGATATVGNSIISFNTNGAKVQNTGILNLVSCQVTGNTNALTTEQSTSTIRLSGNSIFDNSNLFATSLGSVYTYGDNKMYGNGTSTGALMLISTK